MVRTILILIICGYTFNLYSQKDDSIVELGIPAEKEPVKEGLCSFILERTVYPQTAINDTIQGVVIVDFYVEISGETTNHKVIRGVREDLNNEALRVARLLNFDEPASVRDTPVRYLYPLPIYFTMNYDSVYSIFTPKIKCMDTIKERKKRK